MPQIKAIVFDSDGTLIDGYSVIAGAYATLAARHGYPVPTPAEVRAQLALARPLADIYRTFFPTANIEEMIRENGGYIMEHAMDMRGYEGLVDMLALLQARGLRLALLTGANHKVHDLFRHHDIERYFTSIVHSDRISRAKPDPEGFLLAMDECGTLPAEAIMIGDSSNDIFAGKNAGARFTVGITHGNGSRESLAATDPDYIVDSLLELSDLLLRLTDE